jgi:hypothetical protein
MDTRSTHSKTPSTTTRSDGGTYANGRPIDSSGSSGQNRRKGVKKHRLSYSVPLCRVCFKKQVVFSSRLLSPAPDHVDCAHVAMYASGAKQKRTFRRFGVFRGVIGDMFLLVFENSPSLNGLLLLRRELILNQCVLDCAPRCWLSKLNLRAGRPGERVRDRCWDRNGSGTGQNAHTPAREGLTTTSLDVGSAETAVTPSILATSFSMTPLQWPPVAAAAAE